MPVVDLGPDTALCDTEQITLDAGNPGETFTGYNGSLKPKPRAGFILLLPRLLYYLKQVNLTLR